MDNSGAPMFDPETGQGGFIPVDQVPQAVKDGKVRGVSLWTKDGQQGIVPLDQAKAAMAGGLSASKPTPQFNKTLPASDRGVPMSTKGASEQAMDVFKGVAGLPVQLLAPPKTDTEKALWNVAPHAVVAKRAITDPMQHEAELARQTSGAESFGHAVASGIPVFGSMAAGAGEAFARGEGVSGALQAMLTLGAGRGMAESTDSVGKVIDDVSTKLGKTAREKSMNLETRYVGPDVKVQDLRGATNNVLARHGLRGETQSIIKGIDSKINLELMPQYNTLLKKLDETGVRKDVGARINAIINDAIAKTSNVHEANALIDFRNSLNYEKGVHPETGKQFIDFKKPINLNGLKPSELKRLVIDKADNYGFGDTTANKVVRPIARQVRFAANDTMWGDVESGKQLGRDVSHLMDDRESLDTKFKAEARTLGTKLHAAIYGGGASTLGTLAAVKLLMHGTNLEAGVAGIAAYGLAAELIDLARSTPSMSFRAYAWNRLADVLDPQRITDIWPNASPAPKVNPGMGGPNFGPMPGPTKPPISPQATYGPVRAKPSMGPNIQNPGELSQSLPLESYKRAVENGKAAGKPAMVTETPAANGPAFDTKSAIEKFAGEVGHQPSAQDIHRMTMMGDWVGVDGYIRDLKGLEAARKSGPEKAQMPEKAGPKASPEAPRAPAEPKPEPATKLVNGKRIRTEAGRAKDAAGHAELAVKKTEAATEFTKQTNPASEPDEEVGKLEATKQKLLTEHPKIYKVLMKQLSASQPPDWAQMYHAVPPTVQNLILLQQAEQLLEEHPNLGGKQD